MVPLNSTDPLEPRNPTPLLVSDWHRVGAGLSVRFSLRGEMLQAEWRTRPPTKREWRRVMVRYRQARGSFVAAVEKSTGRTATVLEVRK